MRITPYFTPGLRGLHSLQSAFWGDRYDNAKLHFELPFPLALPLQFLKLPIKVCASKDGDEKVTSKYNSALSQIFRVYSILFTLYNTGEVASNWIGHLHLVRHNPFTPKI